MRLGAFSVGPLVAAGGFGSVHSGVHVPSGEPVAIKLLPPLTAHGRLGFEREVRALCSIPHPDVIGIHDLGFGAPDPSIGGWLVMEWASGGSLDQRPLESWGAVEGVLRTVLAALGAAHARDVLHRDVKAANVLWCTADDPRPGWKLADFGMARVDGEATRGGTRTAMAPEQLRGRAADEGPWTDLYAVGALAWGLVTGRPPFDGEDLAAVAGEMARGLPRFVPRILCPAGTRDWLAWLLEPDPHDRPDRAAHALENLATLGSAVGVARPWTHPVHHPSSTATFHMDDDWALAEPIATPGAARSRWTPDPVPDLPAAPIASEVEPLGSAGLSLAAWREVPLLGRRREEEALWEALRRTVAGERIGLRLVGPRGGGTTAIMRWLAARAHETGVAEPWVAAGDRPLRAWLGPALGLHGATNRGDTVTRLEARWGPPPDHDPDLWEVVAEVWMNEGDTSTIAATLPSRLAGHVGRPPLFLVDSEDPLAHEAAATLLQAGSGGALVVVSGGNASTDFTPLPVEPLANEVLEQIVLARTGVRRTLAAAMASRAGGRPKVALAGLLSALDRMVLGPDGWDLPSDSAPSPALPDDPEARDALVVAAAQQLLRGHVPPDQWDPRNDALVRSGQVDLAFGGWVLDRALLTAALEGRAAHPAVREALRSAPPEVHLELLLAVGEPLAAAEYLPTFAGLHRDRVAPMEAVVRALAGVLPPDDPRLGRARGHLARAALKRGDRGLLAATLEALAPARHHPEVAAIVACIEAEDCQTHRPAAFQDGDPAWSGATAAFPEWAARLSLFRAAAAYTADWPDGEEVMADSQARCEALGDPILLRDALQINIRFASYSRRHDRAQQLFDRFITLCGPESWTYHALEGALAHDRGDLVATEVAYRTATRLAIRGGTSGACSLSFQHAMALIRLGRAVEAGEVLTTVRRLAKGRGRAELLHHARALHTFVALAAGDLEGANAGLAVMEGISHATWVFEELLRSALPAFASLGSEALLERARRAMALHRRPPTPGDDTGADRRP